MFRWVLLWWCQRLGKAFQSWLLLFLWLLLISQCHKFQSLFLNTHWFGNLCNVNTSTFLSQQDQEWGDPHYISECKIIPTFLSFFCQGDHFHSSICNNDDTDYSFSAELLIGRTVQVQVSTGQPLNQVQETLLRNLIHGTLSRSVCLCVCNLATSLLKSY